MASSVEVSMKLLFVGDVMIGRMVNEMLAHEAPEFLWGNTLPLFREADWRMCNLECCLSNNGQPWPEKTFHFRSDEKNIAVLKAAGINAVSLANNHALDFGSGALQDTLRILDNAGIARAGAGTNWREASQPAVSDARGAKIAFISFTDNEPEWAATDDQAGVFYFRVGKRKSHEDELLELVQTAKEKSDFAIVAAHWGGNWGWTPPQEHVLLGRRLIDAGADAVIGHSPHVFRGVEIYRSRPIIYSAGNFVDDYIVNKVERNDWSFIFILETDGPRLLRLRLHPTVIRHYQAWRAPDDEAQIIAKKMLELCAALGTEVSTCDGGALEIKLSA